MPGSCKSTSFALRQHLMSSKLHGKGRYARIKLYFLSAWAQIRPKRLFATKMAIQNRTREISPLDG